MKKTHQQLRENELITKFANFCDENNDGLQTLSNRGVRDIIDFWLKTIDELLQDQKEGIRRSIEESRVYTLKLPDMGLMEGRTHSLISKDDLLASDELK